MNRVLIEYKKRNFCFIVICLLSSLCFSQGENDNWYFGNQAGVNFSGNSPVTVNGGQTNTFEGASTISDSSGQLLFYSDGRRVWNKDHQIMANGSLLTSSGHDATQGVVIIPFPNHPNEYFIFTTNGGGIPPPESGPYFDFMAYSKVDMTLNNGLGDVIELNTPLEDQNGNTTWVGRVEAITVINNNNQNYWVVMPHQNKLLSYYVDENGVNTSPVQSDINWVTSTTSHIKISPNNQFLAITEFQQDRTTLYDFDGSTGQVVSSTPLGYFIVENPNGIDLGIYSTEFSSQSNNIWLSIFTNSDISVYGFNLNNLNQTPAILQSNNAPLSFGTLQRGTDDEIYLASLSYNHLISISNSNDISSAVLNDQAVFLNGGISRLGLPQLVPILTSLSCLEDIVLNTPELNANFIYEASNSILTNQNYIVSINQNITLSAGNHIELNPNTEIIENSEFLAEIGGCITNKNKIESFKKDKPFRIYINLEERVRGKSKVKLYPNPTNKDFNISIEDDSVEEIIITSLEGLNLLYVIRLNTNLYNIDLSAFKKGIYIVTIVTKSGESIVKRVVRN